MNKFLMSLLIIGAVFIFVLGGGAGILYQSQTQKDTSQSEKAQKTESVIKALSSKVVVSTVAYGEVTKIEGKDITLNFAGESLTAKIKDDSQILSFVQATPLKKGDPVATTQQLVEFKDIKVGDNLNIALKLLPDGQIQGTRVIIVPNYTLPTYPAK